LTIYIVDMFNKMSLKKIVKEALQDKDLFKKNLSKIQSTTIDANEMPKGITSFPNEFRLVFVDAHLALLKHFKKKYKLRGEKARVENLMDLLGVEKHVRISSLYPPFKILRKSVLNAKGENQGRLARVFQYKNKFIPLDREDFHIMAIDAIENDKLLGPCSVVDLSDSTREDIGNPLGDMTRMERVYQFLEIPKEDEVKDEPDLYDKEGGKLTKKQIDLFNRPGDEASVDIGFKNPIDTTASIQGLDDLDNYAHKVRATLLMINRAKATLKRTKDPKKKRNIISSLKKWQNYKNRLIDKQ
jgi:hypothetical protein